MAKTLKKKYEKTKPFINPNKQNFGNSNWLLTIFMFFVVETFTKKFFLGYLNKVLNFKF